MTSPKYPHILAADKHKKKKNFQDKIKPYQHQDNRFHLFSPQTNTAYLTSSSMKHRPRMVATTQSQQRSTSPATTQQKQQQSEWIEKPGVPTGTTMFDKSLQNINTQDSNFKVLDQDTQG
jgi:hypothetical protein